VDPAEWRRPGRPGHGAETWAEVREEARAALARLGPRAGERTVHRELGGRYTLYQVRVVLREL
jgi:hypothetical protein